MFLKIFIAYLCVISAVSVAVCIYDKFAAKHITKHRTPEAVLLLLSALGGSVAMLLTMLLIRHKTKHMKFMIGIPVIILVQAVIAAAVVLLI
ncbi:MAG: DUF1294 domain-containing protein [Ruminococcaceae bacterium]|nr:DUF1294 domain-containing protein [Oscillospiraceae bacterium]